MERPWSGDTSALSRELATRSLYHGANFAPTPESLETLGCMAFVMDDVIIPTLKAHPESAKAEAALSSLSDPKYKGARENWQTFMKWFSDNQLGSIQKPVPQLSVGLENFRYGDIVVAEKPPNEGRSLPPNDPRRQAHDRHIMVAAPIPAGWNERGGTGMMFVGNTGLDLTGQYWHKNLLPNDMTPPYPHAQLAQEFIGPGLDYKNTDHGTLNRDSANNPYRGGSFTMLRMTL